MKPPSKSLCRATTSNTGDQTAPGTWVLLRGPHLHPTSAEARCHLHFVRGASEVLLSLAPSSELYDSQVLHCLPVILHCSSLSASVRTHLTHHITTTRFGPQVIPSYFAGPPTPNLPQVIAKMLQLHYFWVLAQSL